MPTNLGYKDYKKTLQGIDLDIVSLPPRSFFQPIDDFCLADVQGEKILISCREISGLSHRHKYVTFSLAKSVYSPHLSNAQHENPVQRALNSANATLNR